MFNYEKESTQQGLDIYAQLSAQVVRAASTSTEHTQFSGRPSAHKHIKTGLRETGRSIQSLVARLQTHEALISSQLKAMSLKEALTEPVAAQLARLQQRRIVLANASRSYPKLANLPMSEATSSKTSL